MLQIWSIHEINQITHFQYQFSHKLINDKSYERTIVFI